MNEPNAPITIREVLLGELAPPDEHDAGGWLHAPFRALHREWTARGVDRWLDLARRDGPRPVVVFGAFAGVEPRLVGVVMGAWARAPLDRFDDLYGETPEHKATSRPEGGAWHMIGVTTDPSSQLRGLGLGRKLLASALAWARDREHRWVRTLSPALGLPELVAAWPGGWSALPDAVATSAEVDGRAVLKVLRLHLGGGATLERILTHSRHDDLGSGQVTLRFLYATDPLARHAQREAFRAWIVERRAIVARGDATLIAPDVYRVLSGREVTFVRDA